jgi:hypothetical protein
MGQKSRHAPITERGLNISSVASKRYVTDQLRKYLEARNFSPKEVKDAMASRSYHLRCNCNLKKPKGAVPLSSDEQESRGLRFDASGSFDTRHDRHTNAFSQSVDQMSPAYDAEPLDKQNYTTNW